MPVVGSMQVQSKDGYTYVYILAERRWYKFCLAERLPDDVRSVVDESKAVADHLSDKK